MEPKQALTQFESFNRTRIERLRELAPKNQQDFFDLLALLFHLNDKNLPGYCNEETPVGIVDYQPSNAVLNSAKLLNPNFNFKRRPFRHYPILGMYLINDYGSLHYAKPATFELWLVHSSQESHTDYLHDKLLAVSTWADSLNITLTTRLLSEESLTQTPLPPEDLNRLYLNGLVLAGSSPLWWAISPEQEASNYVQAAQSITQQRLLGHTSILDFGPLPKAHNLFLVEHTFSLLLNSVEQGLAPVLDLLYYQHLLTNYPDSLWLCNQAKEAVYQGEREPLFIDTNVLKLVVLLTSETLGNEDSSLAQQSLYLAFNERLSKHVSQAQYPWRRAVIEQLIALWKWPQHQSQTCDRHQDSSYRQYRSEHERVSELQNRILNSLVGFAQHHDISISQQTEQFRLKYGLFHDAAPDTIPCLPNALLPNNEDYLYLHRFKTETDWYISDVALTSQSDQVLYKAGALLQVIAWAVRNRVLVQSNQLKIADHTEKTSTSTVLKLVQQLLRTSLSATDVIPSETSLATTAECEQVMLFINLEHDGPQDSLTQQGLVRSSLQSDPLNYALKKQNLVFSLEGLIYSTWGQWHYFSHTGKAAVPETMNTILRWQPQQDHARLTLCWCPSESHGATITRRISRLYSDVITHYKNHSLAGNYLVSIAEIYYQIQWQPGSSDFTIAKRGLDTATILSSEREHFSATKVDSYLDPSGLYSQLLDLQSPSQLTFFIYLKKQLITIYILDEQGTLFQQTFQELNESTLKGHFHHFLEMVKQKNNIAKLRFYRLTMSLNKNWEISALPLAQLKQKAYLPVTIELSAPDNDALCTIHCGPKQFSGKVNDQALFKSVNELVQSFRTSNGSYPLYITKLSFPESKQYSSYHYIVQKQKIEKSLNSRS